MHVTIQEIPVVILAGGLGLRIDSGGDTRPKALLEADGISLIERVIHLYEKNGFSNFIICVGHEADQIITHRYSHINPDSRLIFVDSGAETNTSGRLLSIKDYVKQGIFMCTYADGLANVDFSLMLRNHLDSQNLATVVVAKERSQYGVIELLGPSNKVTDFKEKPITNNWINIGFFIFSKEVFTLLNPDQQLEPNLLPKLIENGTLAAHKYEGSYYTVDTRKDLANLETDIQKGVIDWI
jgi:glucose-1-phosphate cytidylyltransferase